MIIEYKTVNDYSDSGTCLVSPNRPYPFLSLLFSCWARSSKWQLVSLLHDAPEYVIGDLITPLKYALNNSYRDVEDNLMKAIHIRFGLPPELPRSIESKIKRIDKAVAWYEAINIAGYDNNEALVILKKPILKNKLEKILPMSSNVIAKKFLKRFSELI